MSWFVESIFTIRGVDGDKAKKRQGTHTMRVTATFGFVPEKILPGLTPSLLPAAESCTAGGPALADVKAFDTRLVVALTRCALALVRASFGVLP
jgi:hypothetical protein